MYTKIITSNFVSVMNMETGEVSKIVAGDSRFAKAYELCKAGDLEAVFNLKPEIAINKAFSSVNDNAPVKVYIEDGVVYYTTMEVPDEVYELNNGMTKRILDMIGQGFEVTPFVLFMQNLLQNPSKTAIDELYGFMEASELPLTDDGHFIAYKIVNNDYTSIYDNKTPNNVGTTPSMPRASVDDRRDNTCSTGLHFCSKSYLNAYGSSRRGNDRLLLLKINPADVVSIPSDYHNAKGRASKYLIWKDITTDEWRAQYHDRDYTTTAVERTVEVVENGPKAGSGYYIYGYHHGYYDFPMPVCSNWWYQQLVEEGYRAGQDDVYVGDPARYVFVEKD